MLRQLSSRDNRNALRYGVCAMCCSMLHSLFTSFYVEYFVRGRLKNAAETVSDTLAVFTIGQLGYAIWNGANDVFFGWYGDRHSTQMDRRRLARISVGGPLWALVFALLWIPQSSFPVHVHPAVHLSVLMILYDCFFSYTTVAFRALLTDISTSPRERERCNAAAAVFHVIGSAGVAVASYLYEYSTAGSAPVSPSAGATVGSSSDSLTSFRYFTTFLALGAAVGFVASATNGKEVVLKTQTGSSEPPASFLSFCRETCSRKSMVAVLSVWAIQEYSCTFATNFFAMFLSIVCGDLLSLGFRSSLLLLSYVVPHVVVLGVTPLLATVGKKTIISHLFLLRAAAGLLLMYLANRCDGYDATEDVERRTVQWTFAALLLANRVLTEAVCRLQPLVLSDVADEDTVIFSRPSSQAAAVCGITSVISKPSQSIAPVVTCYYLAFRGVLAPLSDDVAAAPLSLSRWIVYLVGASGFVTAASMWVIWREFYSLDGGYLLHIQQLMKQRCNLKPDSDSSLSSFKRSDRYV